MLRITATLAVLATFAQAQFSSVLWPKNKDAPVPCPYESGIMWNECPVEKYRSLNGSCNNLGHPGWGMNNRPLSRLLPPDYEDGLEVEKIHSVLGSLLPSARLVSLKLFQDQTDDKSPLYTIMHMFFGQLLDHDVTRSVKGKKMTDCAVGGNCDWKGECTPMVVPPWDPKFAHNRCLKFIRSKPVLNLQCQASREQLNGDTAYIDASMIYGNGDSECEKLRDWNNPFRGQLKMTHHPYDRHLKNLLPQKDDPKCRHVDNVVRCFSAGDSRCNVANGLLALHTIFHRAHNTIENHLHYLNPHWHGNRLFQESRRILGAVWQHITYKEYLPLLFGPNMSREYGLVLGVGSRYWNGYNPKINADIFNSFSTAAFRFGHSQISDFTKFVDKDYSNFKEEFLSTQIFRPAALYDPNKMGGSGVDALIRGMAIQPAETVNVHFADQMSNSLFTQNPPHGAHGDLPATNVKRGRDHGLPGYNKYRSRCGLSVAHDFNDLVDIPSVHRDKLAQLYKHVDDIDLYVGGISEIHVTGGMVGPTFACILGKQFRNLRKADRFWYEKQDRVHGFSPRQLGEIRKYSMAYLICENGDYINFIQPKALVLPKRLVSPEIKDKYPSLINLLYHDGPNEFKSCLDYHRPDLSLWKE